MNYANAKLYCEEIGLQSAWVDSFIEQSDAWKTCNNSACWLGGEYAVDAQGALIWPRYRVWDYNKNISVPLDNNQVAYANWGGTFPKQQSCIDLTVPLWEMGNGPWIDMYGFLLCFCVIDCMDINIRLSFCLLYDTFFVLPV